MIFFKKELLHAMKIVVGLLRYAYLLSLLPLFVDNYYLSVYYEIIKERSVKQTVRLNFQLLIKKQPTYFGERRLLF